MLNVHKSKKHSTMNPHISITQLQQPATYSYWFQLCSFLASLTLFVVSFLEVMPGNKPQGRIQANSLILLKLISGMSFQP